MNDLAQRYNYVQNILPEPAEVVRSIREKKVVPYQVEVQPGPLKGPLCWLKCPYCYGGAALDSGERLAPERYVTLMHELADGGVPKIVFAGYATDPLNYEFIHDLVEVAVNSRQIVGFHTKALQIGKPLMKLLTERQLADKSYFSISVDAGSDTVYNQVHGVRNMNAKLLTRVIKNIKDLTASRRAFDTRLDLSATYLINHLNCDRDEVLTAIDRLRDAGVDLIRFTFPQLPREGVQTALSDYVPGREAVEMMMVRLHSIIERENSRECQVVIRDMDKEFGTIDLQRSLPCFARFVFPSVGFDGWLYHCSESASLDFRGLALGNLAKSSFWDCYYNYDAEALECEIAKSCLGMDQAGCKCDRKEHGVNGTLLRHVDLAHEDLARVVNQS